MTRIIKKYQNRKLYDSEESHYVTVKDVMGMVKSGVKVMVVDDITKKDVTRNILFRGVVDSFSGETVSVETLEQFIRNGGSLVLPSVSK